MGEEQPDSLYPFLVFFSNFLIIELDGRGIEVADRDLPFPLCPFPLPSSIDDSTESVFKEIEPIRNCQNQLLGTNCNQAVCFFSVAPTVQHREIYPPGTFHARQVARPSNQTCFVCLMNQTWQVLACFWRRSLKLGNSRLGKRLRRHGLRVPQFSVPDDRQLSTQK